MSKYSKGQEIIYKNKDSVIFLYYSHDLERTNSSLDSNSQRIPPSVYSTATPRCDPKIVCRLSGEGWLRQPEVIRGILSVNSGNLQSVTENPVPMEMRKRLTTRDSMWNKTPIQTGKAASRVRLSPHFDESSLSHCQGAQNTSASRMNSSTDKALPDIVLHFMGRKRKGWAALQNF